jgi:hypothetical protein
MSDGFSIPDALNENPGVIGFSAGAAGLRSLAGVRREVESLKALLAKDADERRMQSFLREKLYQFRQQLDRIAKIESPMQRYVDAMALQEVFTEAAITSSMLNELGDKQYLAALQDDLTTATRSPGNERATANELVSGYILVQLLPLLLKVQDSSFALEQEIGALESDVAATPAPIALAEALRSGRPRMLLFSFLLSGISILLVALGFIVSFHFNKRVLSIEGSLDFGPAPIGQDTIRRVKLVNKGTQPLTIDGFHLPVGFREANSWTGVIPARGSQEIQVIFSPVDDMLYGGGFKVFHNATRIEELPSLSGFGRQPLPPIVNIALSTGSNMLYPPTRRSLLIDNIGEAVYSFSVSCPAGFELNDGGGSPAESKDYDLAPGDKIRIFVDFRPQEAGLYAGEIVIQPKIGKQRRFPISGEAFSPSASDVLPQGRAPSLRDK